MRFSIRTKLTILYVTIMTVTLVTFGMAFSYSLSRVFMNSIDAQISSIADMMVHTVIKPTGQLFLPEDFDIILERFFGIRTAGNYIQVLDVHGRIVARSSSLEGLTLPLSEEAYVNALNGKTTFEVVRKGVKKPVRMVTKPIKLKDENLAAITQVGSSLEGMDEIFHSLAYILAAGTIVSVLVASLAGWFIARRALKPVTEITETARRIGAENLNERINIAVPRDEIGRLASTINEMIGRLEKSFRQIQQFTADASHELKTPLTILKGEMEIALRSNAGREEMREALKSSLEEIDRMNYIVRNLLDLARMDVERGVLARERVDLEKVLRERFEHFRRLAADGGVGLAIIRSRPSAVYGDAVRISQMVYNLIDNALKYTPRGGKVDLTLDEEAGFAALRVRDTGVGISGEDIPFLFDRFYRVDKARSREVGGAGLGLSICKEIAESHGGSIEVESELNKGSCFTARLPLADSPQPA